MPRKLNPTADKRVYSELAELGRHMKGCKSCTAARKSSDPTMMCLQGLNMTLGAAHDFAQVVKLRIAAHTKHPGAIFACPDLPAHGATYALTATPYQVIAIQDALF